MSGSLADVLEPGPSAEMGRFIATGVDWNHLLECAHASVASEVLWAESILRALHDVFPASMAAGLYLIEHGGAPERMACRRLAADPAAPLLARETIAALAPALGLNADLVVGAATTGACSGRELLVRLEPHARHGLAHVFRSRGFVDVLALYARPTPETSLLVTVHYDRRVELTRYERRLLARLGLHLESGYRVRRRMTRVVAEVTSGGNIASFARSVDPKSLWTALHEGRSSLVPRFGEGGIAYAVVEAPAESRLLRALSEGERNVAELAARGHPTKVIAIDLRVSEAAVSNRLSTAVAKLGAVSRHDLLRVVASLTREPRSEFPSVAITEAEREILELVRRGMSNREIARVRARSVSTIASQVASLLKKLARPSRRALMVGR